MEMTLNGHKPEPTVQTRVRPDVRDRFVDRGVKPGDVLAAVADLPDTVIDRLLAGDTTAVTTARLVAPVAEHPTPTVARPVADAPIVATAPAKRPTQAEARAAASRRAVGTATVAAAAVAVASGCLSVRATAAFAVASGVTKDDWTAWLFSVAVEGSMAAASVVLWARHGNRVLAWLVMVAATALAVAANVAHNPDATLAGKWFSAVPPVATLAAIELVASLRARGTVPTVTSRPSSRQRLTALWQRLGRS